eukprot:2058306-Prymnesium_polylepis.2
MRSATPTTQRSGVGKDQLQTSSRARRSGSHDSPTHPTTIRQCSDNPTTVPTFRHPEQSSMWTKPAVRQNREPDKRSTMPDIRSSNNTRQMPDNPKHDPTKRPTLRQFRQPGLCVASGAPPSPVPRKSRVRPSVPVRPSVRPSVRPVFPSSVFSRPLPSAPVQVRLPVFPSHH